MADVVKKWISYVVGSDKEIGEQGLHFVCPGCNDLHSISYGNGRWQWNENLELPTISPSILVRTGHHAGGSAAETGQCWCNFEERTGEKTRFKCGVCHSFVNNGMIQFLGDCTHALANQTVKIPDWDTHEQIFD